MVPQVRRRRHGRHCSFYTPANDKPDIENRFHVVHGNYYPVLHCRDNRYMREHSPLHSDVHKDFRRRAFQRRNGTPGSSLHEARNEHPRFTLHSLPYIHLRRDCRGKLYIDSSNPAYV